jgi:hypothetical protein
VTCPVTTTKRNYFSGEKLPKSSDTIIYCKLRSVQTQPKPRMNVECDIRNMNETQ